MKKLYLLALMLIPVLANAQMKTWESFSESEIDHPFKNTYVNPPANNIDSKGNKWVLNSNSIWKINGTDTTKFTDFPITNTTNRGNSMLSILDDQVVFYHYRYDRVNNVNKYTNYLGFYDGTEMKFYSETTMNVGVSTSSFTDIKQTEKYVWITKSDKLIGFDKANTFVSYSSANSVIMEGISNPRLYKSDSNTMVLINGGKAYAFEDSKDLWENLISSDLLQYSTYSDSTKTIYIVGDIYIYSYSNKILQSFDVPNLSSLGKAKSIEEFKKNTSLANYEKGFVLIDNEQVYVEYYANYINAGSTSLYHAIPNYLDNGILVFSIPVNYDEKMFFSFYNNKIEFEGIKTASDGFGASFFDKTLAGSAYFYSTKTDYNSYPYSRTLFVVKNDKDTFSIAVPIEEGYFTSDISVDSNYIWIKDSLSSYYGGNKILRMKRDQYFVKGNLFYDNNKNGLKETTEVGISKYPVRINPSGLIVYPDRNGDFSFAGTPGEKYTMELPDAASFNYTSQPLPYTFIESENNKLGVTLANPTPEIRTNFITPWPRCGTTGKTTLQIENVGFEPIDKAQFVLVSDPMAEINSAEALEQKADTLVFELNNLLPLNPQSLSYEVTFPGGEMTGQKLTFQLLSSIYDKGSIIKSEKDSITTIVRCSFDPNDKAVTPAGIGEDNFTLKNSTLSYLIRFENTGNDTAYTVTVYDTLDVNMDLSTFAVLGSSHKVITELSQEGVLIFHFEDIMLPDNKTDLENAQGFVRFAIKPKTGLAENTVVKNKAGIVFDSNTPVITNETFNTLVTTLPVLTAINAVRENKNLVYPNPATNMVYITNTNTTKVEVYDFTGRQISTYEKSEINTSTWEKGFYLFRMFDAKGNSLGSEKVLIAK
jgi:uncharacterized repeat protein (TIGR01451 family)